MGKTTRHRQIAVKAGALSAVLVFVSAYAQTTYIPGGGAWFIQVHDFLLQRQLSHCAEYESAGNKQLAAMCRTEALNAHDYLLARATYSILPTLGWSVCANEI